ncbi:C3 protein [Tomato leaf curl virus-[Australia:Darwin:2003]]|nr:C3 protein [Tomato leaf curl virus-[Australia:Darwin:2003]]
MDSRTGELITARQAMNGEYIWRVPNPLYFKIIEHLQRPFNYNHDIIHVRIQFNHNLRKALGIHKCFLNFKVFTRLQPATWRFLRVFKIQVMKYLDSLGVISINNVIRSVDHVLYNVLASTFDVIEDHDIKYNFY